MLNVDGGNVETVGTKTGDPIIINESNLSSPEMFDMEEKTLKKSLKVGESKTPKGEKHEDPLKNNFVDKSDKSPFQEKTLDSNQL